MSPIASVRIRLRYADLDSFVEKFAPNVTRGGLFLATRNVQAVGAVVSFEIQLAGGEVALAGEGKVTWVRQFDPAEPNRPYGMGVQFTGIDARTRPVLARILRGKDASGRPNERRPTGAYIPLDAAAAPAGGNAAGGSGSALRTGIANGSGGGSRTATASSRGGALAAVPAAAARIDTSVDLAAEFGIDDATLRRVMDRSWVIGPRLDGGDLDDLLRPEPVEPATLGQALQELPRLLDPQASRRRLATTGIFRPLEAIAIDDDEAAGGGK